MQPYFFPYIGYWQLIQAADTFVLLDDVNYIRRGWMARNRYRCDGRIQWFRIPVRSASQNRLICDTEIHPDPVPRKNIVKTLRYAYRNAPYMKTIIPAIEDIFMSEESSFTSKVQCSLRTLCEFLEIDTRIVRASDMRERNHMRGIEGVLELCDILSADCYLNPIGGKTLYNALPFRRNGLELSFLQTNFEEMKRRFGEDEYDLSIIDLLCRFDRKQVISMLYCYDIINDQ